MSPAVGDLVVVNFPEQDPQGREQEGKRPAVLAGLPETLGSTRFGVVFVIPLTGAEDNQRWADQAPDLYPRLASGTGGLVEDSIVLLDQLRAVDKKRVTRKIGTLPKDIVALLKQSLRTILELG
ncbi:MAG: type II toxin-antitoxin system PemK/MazF family toxin [Trueperaceae bacterium]|nr:type II toxin-antitoxin system PemK/MazF family toxin [Trueperaceae bacterium]